MGDTPLLSVVQARLWHVSRERWLRRVVARRKHSSTTGFFDAYPRFFSTSVTSATPNRLNQRHRALIQANTDHLLGRRVLDLASHDGRWSFAAQRAGAEHVLGVKARQHLVEAARRNLREYRVPETRVEFLQGDVMVELDRLDNRHFDTVLCFGFFYHIIDHMLLLRKIARLKPTNLLIDTNVSRQPGSVIEVDDELVENERAAAFGDPGNPLRAIRGKPSRAALEMMLKAVGFSVVRYWDWLNAGIGQWDDLGDYYLGERVSLTAVSAV